MTSGVVGRLDLAAVYERWQRATPSPWGWYQVDSDEPTVFGGRDQRTIAYFPRTENGEDSADAEFVAHAREDVSLLLAEVNFQHGRLARLCADLRSVAKWTSDPRARAEVERLIRLYQPVAGDTVR